MQRRYNVPKLTQLWVYFARVMFPSQARVRQLFVCLDRDQATSVDVNNWVESFHSWLKFFGTEYVVCGLRALPCVRVRRKQRFDAAVHV
jgi:hypothetical protein